MDAHRLVQSVLLDLGGAARVSPSPLDIACGDDSSAVPFESIPKDKKLVELSPPEQQSTCQWVTQLTQQKLGGRQLSCGSTPLTFNTCGFPTAAQMRCTATLGQWESCIPGFIDRIVQDPCKVLGLAFSQTALEDFVNGTPGCEGIGPCAYTVH